MLNTTKVLILLCLTKFLQNFKPSEPFVAQILEQPRFFSSLSLSKEETPENIEAIRNFRDNYVFQAYRLAQPFFAILTCFLVRYFIVYDFLALGIIIRLITRMLLLFCNDMRIQILMQVLYSYTISVDVVLPVYAASVVHSHQLLLAHGVIQSSKAAAKLTASLLGQYLLDNKIEFGADKFCIHLSISFGAVLLACFVFLFLPRIDRRVGQEGISLKTVVHKIRQRLRTREIGFIIVIISLTGISQSTLDSYFISFARQLSFNFKEGFYITAKSLFVIATSLLPSVLLASSRSRRMIQLGFVLIVPSIFVLIFYRSQNVILVSTLMVTLFGAVRYVSASVIPDFILTWEKISREEELIPQDDTGAAMNVFSATVLCCFVSIEEVLFTFYTEKTAVKIYLAVVGCFLAGVTSLCAGIF